MLQNANKIMKIQNLKTFNLSYFLGNNCFGYNAFQNSLTSHTDNRKNSLLVLGKRPTDYINGSVGAAEKKFSINFSKAKKKILLKFPS